MDHREIARKWKMDYTFAAGDPSSRALDALHGLCAHFSSPSIDIQAMFEDAANLISKQFGIREVTVGTKDPTDGLFRYRAFVGVKKESEEALRKTSYTADDFLKDEEYRGTTLSKYTRLYLSEDSPYANNERDTYSHPVLLASKRRSLTDSVEGDYVDVHILGEDDELIGWIEMSGTRTGNLPSVETIRWVELISLILGTALVLEEARGRRRKGPQRFLPRSKG